LTVFRCRLAGLDILGQLSDELADIVYGQLAERACAEGGSTRLRPAIS
jgi:hypothetical protein